MATVPAAGGEDELDLVPDALEVHGQGAVLPPAMTWPLWVLAVPTVLVGLVLAHPPDALRNVHVDPLTALAGTALSVAGLAWGIAAASRNAERDALLALPVRVTSFLRAGYRLDEVQQALVVRPYGAIARLVRGGDRDVVDGYVRGVPVLARWGSVLLARAQSGLATGYLAWLAVGAVVVGVVGVVLT